jgi:hypothetical protein
MKETTAEFATAGVWGLHITSYLMAAVPYLQILSLTLAIVVSTMTIVKMVRSPKKKSKNEVK